MIPVKTQDSWLNFESGRREWVNYVKLAILFCFGLSVFYTLSSTPSVAILMLDIVACTYLASLFGGKYKFLFLLHPILIFLSSQLFTGSFLSAGDGETYQAVIPQYLNTNTLSFDIDELYSLFGFIEMLKYSSLSAVPIFAIPQYFFPETNDQIYYLWQSLYHVILCTIATVVAQSFRVIQNRYLYSIIFFAVLAPSFFDLGATPTRHITTFFGVFLLFSTHQAITQEVTIPRILWFATAVATILISKAPLLIPYFLFVGVDLYFIQQVKARRRIIFFLGLYLCGLVVMAGYWYRTFLDYKEIADLGSATFGLYTQLPILGLVIKYIYALLAPFPWSDAPHFVATTYTGNWFLFILHIMSAITGVYLVFVLILKWRSILAYDTQLKQLVAFAVIMSLSILRGASGFHVYLLIYFPMLAPLLSIRRMRINLIIPLGFISLMEVAVTLGR